MILGAAWMVRFVNPAGARLLGRPVAELTGREIWRAAPELAGSIFHGFLQHARGAEGPVTQQGFCPSTGRSGTGAALGPAS